MRTFMNVDINKLIHRMKNYFHRFNCDFFGPTASHSLYIKLNIYFNVNHPNLQYFAAWYATTEPPHPIKYARTRAYTCSLFSPSTDSM